MPWWTNVRSRRSGASESTPSAAYRASTSSPAIATIRCSTLSRLRSRGHRDDGVQQQPQPLLAVPALPVLAHNASAGQASVGPPARRAHCLCLVAKIAAWVRLLSPSLANIEDA